MIVTSKKSSRNHVFDVAKRPNIVGQTCEVCFSINIWPFGHVTKQKFFLNFKTFGVCNNCTVLQYSVLSHYLNSQTMLIKHLRLAFQAMFDHFDRWLCQKTLFDKQTAFIKCFLKIAKIFHVCDCNKPKMFDDQCFLAWPNGETLSLTRKISNVWQTMFGPQACPSQLCTF